MTGNPLTFMLDLLIRVINMGTYVYNFLMTEHELELLVELGITTYLDLFFGAGIGLIIIILFVKVFL